MYADVQYFHEWRSWAVARFDAAGNRERDEFGYEIEARWWAYKGPAVTYAEDLLQRGKIDRYRVFGQDGTLQRTVERAPGEGASA
jgi:diacylglycerol kinase family enzyme